MAEALTSIVACPQCGAKNRINDRVAADKQPVCGNCGAKLPAASESSGAASVAPGKPIEVTDANFEQVLADAGDKPVLVDFWAEWCPPCRALSPTIDKLADQYAGKVVIGKVDTDSNQDLAARYGIANIPTILLFKGGEVVHVFRGARKKEEFEELLNAQAV